ncbi:methyltransferase domain-containing protein [Burkholderiaceae bacterium DAT-1]|nr:methyltransferase domain-containing protein [Burkholderiaceae bacterium DAT-1]
MWNPDQYLKYAGPRLRPALDLLARIDLEAPEHIADLGCGPGNVTACLKARWPDASITGIDNDPSMLAAARRDFPDMHWQAGEVSTWSPDTPVDLLYTNAVLHWVPDHAELFPALLRTVKPGGVMAIGMPGNFRAPSHTLIAETVNAGSWRDSLQHLLQAVPILELDDYYRILAPHAASLDIWETHYMQVLEGADPVKEWIKGSWLKQFLDALPEGEREAFEQDYAARVRATYPAQTDGKTLFPFRRIFMVVRAK